MKNAEPTIILDHGTASRLALLVRRAAVVVPMLGLGVVSAVAIDRVLPSDETSVVSANQDGLATSSVSTEVSSTPAGPDADSEGAVPAAEGPAGDGKTPSVADALPERASRLVAHAPRRALDTREGDAEGTAPDPDVVHQIEVEQTATAVALSVSVLGTERAGSVLIDGRAGAVEAITLGGAGGTTTNFVVVPVAGGPLNIRSTAGGHLVVDVVGTFEHSAESTSGRFVSVEPVTVGELETEIDGRELELAFTPTLPLDEASAVLVVIDADVGVEGGMVRLGPDVDSFDQMLMWAPSDGVSRQRRGLALVDPSDDILAALRYDGGSLLTAEVVGYFTNEGAESGTSGLYVPSGPELVVDGPIGPDDPVSFVPEEVFAGSALLTVGSSSAIAGQLGSVLVPVDDAGLTVTPSADIDAMVTLLGVFLE